MLTKNGLIFIILFSVAAQTPAPNAGRARRAGGLVPGQNRPAGDPVQIARGKTLYGVSCQGCHGADLRGGDMGGPNLLRSPVALTDRDGELIVPIILGARQDSGMPAIPMSPEDAKAVAAYVRSVVATIGRQGMPPGVGKAPATIVVGDASAGRAYFEANCSSCHSATGDLQGVASRIPDPKTLQNTWVAGGSRPRRMAGTPAGNAHPVTATIRFPSGERFEGQLVRIDEFLVTIAFPDGGERTFRRDGDTPNVEIHDPMQAHRKLLTTYTDKNMHDVTAYLVTLK